MAIETYRYNIKIRSGRTVRKKFTFLTKNDADEVVPMDTTGWQGLLEYRETVDSGNYVDFLSSETSPQLITFGGDNGLMEIVFPSIKTEAMREFKKLAYDLKITYPDGDVDYPLAGWLPITKSVTRG
jgi:hypothetical protein